MNAALGVKRQCPKCSTKFYDMNRVPVVCVKCQKPLPEEKPKKIKPVPAPAPKPKPKPKIVTEEEELIDDLDVVVELEQLDDFEEDVEHLEEVEDHHELPEVDVNSDDAEDEMFHGKLGKKDSKLVDEPEEESPDED